jgi:hypothetical protein
MAKESEESLFMVINNTHVDCRIIRHRRKLFLSFVCRPVGRGAHPLPQKTRHDQAEAQRTQWDELVSSSLLTNCYAYQIR